MNKVIFHIIIFFALASCGSEDSTDLAVEKKIVQIGEYKFEFPKDFQIIPGKGIDSQVGEIGNNKIVLTYDYGYYSDPLLPSVDEYIDKWIWKSNALNHSPYGKKMNINPYEEHKNVKLNKSEYLNDTVMNLTFIYKVDTIDYKLTIPKEIRMANVEIDTINNVIYKIVNSTYPENRFIGLYAKNLNNYNSSINSFRALSISSKEINEEDSLTVIEILRSCKRIK